MFSKLFSVILEYIVRYLSTYTYKKFLSKYLLEYWIEVLRIVFHQDSLIFSGNPLACVSRNYINVSKMYVFLHAEGAEHGAADDDGPRQYMLKETASVVRRRQLKAAARDAAASVRRRTLPIENP